MNRKQYRAKAKASAHKGWRAFRAGNRSEGKAHIADAHFYRNAAFAIDLAEAFAAGKQSAEVERKAKDAARKRKSRAKAKASVSNQ